MLEHHVELRSGYVHAALRGQVTLERALAMLLDVFETALAHREPRILLDASAVTGPFTIRDRFAFGERIAALQKLHARTFHTVIRVAIYAVPPLMDPGHFTQTVANNRGARTLTSDRVEDLMAWLEASPTRLIAA